MKSGYTLAENETVIREVNRHWVDLLPVIVSSSVSLLLALGLVYISARYSGQVSIIPSGIITLIALILVVLSGAILSVGLYIFHQNKIILTDMHLIEVVQRGLFSRSVSQLSMARVQDVSATRKGLFATLLDYGTIEVETAGEVDNFVFNLAPHPQQLADECLAIHEKIPAHAVETNPDI
jgi:uncharacterized membrane protein YdbT with pleckstrin-like domain